MSRAKGRIIKKHTVTIQSLKIVLPVRLVEERDHYSGEIPDHTFSIELPEHDVYVRQQESIDDAIDKAKAELEEKLAIEWKPHIQLRVPENTEGYGSNGFKSREVEVQFRFVEIGKAGGKEVWREEGRSDIHDATLRRGDHIKEGYSYGGDTNATFAVLEDNPANRAALKQLCGAFDALNAKLREFLHHEKAQATLANLGRLALPKPSEVPNIFDDEEDDD